VFDSIQGRLLQKGPARAVVEAAGIGYAVQVPLSTFERLPSVGDDVHLLLHGVIRPDEWRLFAFATEGERDVFRALLRVSGVGPLSALGLLSGLEPQAFREAVVTGDVRALTRVKGVGKKTAERIVVDLRDVLAKQVPEGTSAGRASVPGEGPGADAVRALIQLGLDAHDAEKRVARARQKDADASVSALVRAALQS